MTLANMRDLGVISVDATCACGRESIIDVSAGLEDALTTLTASPWLKPMPPHQGARTFDVQRRI